jgi:peptidyl-tRNA hydrolase
MDPADFVLRQFSKGERSEVEVLMEDAADVAEQWLGNRDRAQEKAAHRGRDA